MRAIQRTGAFKKDYQRIVKRGLDIAKLATTIQLLATNQPLPPRMRPHKLSGNYAGVWECHIAPDWLLIYDYAKADDGLAADTTTLILRRTGSHADLFG